MLEELLLHHRDLLDADEKLHILFAGTDGQDGPTPAAGVVLTWPFDDDAQLDATTIRSALERHDSYGYFRAHHPAALIQTGVSGTNVMDIYCMMLLKTSS